LQVESHVELIAKVHDLGFLCYGFFSCWWGWKKIDNSQKGGNGFLFYDDYVNTDKYFSNIPEKEGPT
jgi:hypothetical protein